MHTRNFASRCQRDISNFLQIREAAAEDDTSVGEFLLHAFDTTYFKKMPEAALSEDRKRDLLDVAGRRASGGVWILSLGEQLVGTFSMLHPRSNLAESWLPESAVLRCVAIAPQFHGLGLSERILLESEQIARLWGMKALCLHVVQGSKGVAGVYENFGFLRDARGDGRFYEIPLWGFTLPLSIEALTSPNTR
jgi:GNAT superfamily N-acetyltransferase